MIPEFVGVLNVTPDSFSDGGKFCDPADALQHAKKLLADGASLVEVGGDSTRPGSICVGPELEWQRISGVVAALRREGLPFSVDTHSALVAARAISEGAVAINDVSGGLNQELVRTLVGTQAKFVIMYSRCPAPHEFGPPPAGDLIGNIIRFLRGSADNAMSLGLSPAQIVLDPGMGGFISENPADSFQLLERFGELKELGFPLMLAASRKGFLKTEGEKSVAERDMASAKLAKSVWLANQRALPAFVRAHNVAEHRREFLSL